MKPFKLQSTSKTAYFVGLLIVLVIGGYSVSVALPFLLGPALELDEVSESEQGAVLISGLTRRVSFLEINGFRTPLNENGSFAVERAFPEGYTAVTVAARDRFGRTITKKISFVIDAHGIKKEE